MSAPSQRSKVLNCELHAGTDPGTSPRYPDTTPRSEGSIETRPHDGETKGRWTQEGQLTRCERCSWFVDPLVDQHVDIFPYVSSDQYIRGVADGSLTPATLSSLNLQPLGGTPLSDDKQVDTFRRMEPSRRARLWENNPTEREYFAKVFPSDDANVQTWTQGRTQGGSEQ